MFILPYSPSSYLIKHHLLFHLLFSSLAFAVSLLVPSFSPFSFLFFSIGSKCGILGLVKAKLDRDTGERYTDKYSGVFVIGRLRWIVEYASV